MLRNLLTALTFVLLCSSVVAVAADNDWLTPTYVDPQTGMEFVLVRGGCFRMGMSTPDSRAFEKPVHEVCIDDFYLGRYEVTQTQFETISGTNPSGFQGEDRPVENVSWRDVEGFLAELGQLNTLEFRLPTEAEWEFAARSGGKNEKWAGVSQEEALHEFAWYALNSGVGTNIVGQMKPNGLGLHDMSGNVFEWCADWYGANYYADSPRTDPQGPPSGVQRVVRGGSWQGVAAMLQTRKRFGAYPDLRFNSLGFRVAMSPEMVILANRRLQESSPDQKVVVIQNGEQPTAERVAKPEDR
ncbi:MAG: SUMF1/EgtB/PvdO family nonheme iron enzyme [Desulfuromonadales bacterium]|nr:SUMF1/EgtB/PvdO family nonheme iron enzyme [Desulfuromonadales bacterium]